MTLAILADDLTGACDSAVAFARRGLATRVLLAPRPIAVGPNERVDVVAVDADSRQVTRKVAVARTTLAVRALRTPDATRLFKKVDSTLRGHVGPELLACMRAWDAPLALLCPAFPATGRWVQGGEIFVDRRGSLGSVARLASLPADRRTGHLDLATLRGGVDAVHEALGRLAKAGARVVVADADTPGHLTALVEASARFADSVLLAGSGGLAAALAEWVVRQDAAPDGTPISPTASPMSPSSPSGTTAPARSVASSEAAESEGRPWLVVAGSQTEVTHHQIVELQRAGAEVIEIDLDKLLASRSYARNEGYHAAYLLTQDVTPVLHLVIPPRPEGSPALTPRQEETAARALARVCDTGVLEGDPAGLFLTGGSTARACLLALGAYGIRLEREPLPGIAAGVALGGTWDGKPVITKSGGFGAPDAIRRLVRPRSPGRVPFAAPRPSPPVA